MFRSLIFRAPKVPSLARWLHAKSPLASYNQRYTERLQHKAKEKGLSLDELKTHAREEARRKQKEDALPLLESLKKTQELSQTKSQSNPQDNAGTSPVRKDSSPVKRSQSLSSILNISRLLATPHTSSQISALWTAYHASRTGGTGRGFICATLPVESYNSMTQVARKYPLFVVPVPRESTPETSDEQNNNTAHEFYLLQWDFHPAPPAPTVVQPSPFEPVTSGHLPPISTVLYTPLQEYKHRTCFSTPYLVLTFYTDLAESHGIVLLRGEITPSSTSVAAGQETSARFLLGQVDAQLLTMGLQRFYLWGEGRKDGQQDSSAEELLKQFHEEPEEFSWQDLLEHSKLPV